MVCCDLLTEAIHACSASGTEKVTRQKNSWVVEGAEKRSDCDYLVSFAGQQENLRCQEVADELRRSCASPTVSAEHVASYLETKTKVIWQSVRAEGRCYKPTQAPVWYESGESPVPIVNVEVNENIEFASPPSISPSGAQRASRVGRRHFGGPQIPSHTPVGEPRAPAPAWRAASLREAA